MSDKPRITEAWDWIEHTDGLHHMSRSKHGKWCEISHAMEVINALTTKLEAAGSRVAEIESKMPKVEAIYEKWKSLAVSQAEQLAAMEAKAEDLRRKLDTVKCVLLETVVERNEAWEQCRRLEQYRDDYKRAAEDALKEREQTRQQLAKITFERDGLLHLVEDTQAECDKLRKQAISNGLLAEQMGRTIERLERECKILETHMQGERKVDGKMIDLAELKKLHAAASPGPWDTMTGCPWNVLSYSGLRVARCDFDGDETHPQVAANAKFIAVAHEAISQLLGQLANAEVLVDNLRNINDTAVETIATLEKRIEQLRNACRLASAWFCKPEFGDGSEPNPFQVAQACKEALEVRNE